MAKRTFKIDELPIQHKNHALKMTKPYSAQDFTKHTVLTDNLFTYVSFFFDTHPKSMKYKDDSLKKKFGNPSQYNYKFYWKQAETFYHSAKSIALEASPVAAYYCILNAVKAYLSYRLEFVDDFVLEFGMHGIAEDNEDVGENLGTIGISHKQSGVFPLFAKTLDEDFEKKWSCGKNNSKTVKDIFYNLAFIHRAYTMTYSTKNKTVEELFVPLACGKEPEYHRGSDGKAYLLVELDKSYFSLTATKIPKDIVDTIPSSFAVCEINPFALRSVDGAKRNQGSISSEIKGLNLNYRKYFHYIHSNQKLWFVKRTESKETGVINLSSMTLIMAAMHRISEIARYKPEQLNRLLQSKENWLLHEFISHALDQFVDEIACEITHQEIMCTGNKQ